MKPVLPNTPLSFIWVRVKNISVQPISGVYVTGALRFILGFQDTLFILRRAQTITTQNDVARTLTCFFICTYSMTHVQLRNSFQKDRYVKFLILLAYLYNKRFILIAPRIKRTQQLLSSDSLHVRSILQLNRNFRFICTYV